MKYTVNDLRVDFPDEAACLEWLVNYLYPSGITCKRCQKITPHYPMKTRKSYACGVCGWHCHPTAGTIFEKSSTPLTSWFYAIYLMTATKAGIPAAQLQRQLGVTYKCAWRMLHKIREMMADDSQLSGEVEVDEAYIHANVFKRSSAMQRYGLTGSRTGQVIFGMVERGGHVIAHHVLGAGARVLMPEVEQHIAKGSTIYSDEAWSYISLTKRGYRHFTTNHSQKEYVHPVNKNNYTQNIENFWSHLKRGIKGVYRNVSANHLQKYCNEFAWRYSNRKSECMFLDLMLIVVGA